MRKRALMACRPPPRCSAAGAAPRRLRYAVVRSASEARPVPCVPHGEKAQGCRRQVAAACEAVAGKREAPSAPPAEIVAALCDAHEDTIVKAREPNAAS